MAGPSKAEFVVRTQARVGYPGAVMCESDIRSGGDDGAYIGIRLSKVPEERTRSGGVLQCRVGGHKGRRRDGFAVHRVTGGKLRR